jgi:hypothetical protein
VAGGAEGTADVGGSDGDGAAGKKAEEDSDLKALLSEETGGLRVRVEMNEIYGDDK